jgi:hypothetical protein
MNTIKTIRTVGLAAVVATIPAIIAIAAHAQSPAPAPQAPPGAVKVIPPAADVDTDMSKPATPAPSKGADSAAASTSTVKDVTVGSSVVGSDGQALGEVKGVKADPGGKIEEIHVKTGSILGFGGKIVVIPGAKISKGGQTVQVAMTAAEVGKLPALAEKKG